MVLEDWNDSGDEDFEVEGEFEGGNSLLEVMEILPDPLDNAQANEDSEDHMSSSDETDCLTSISEGNQTATPIAEFKEKIGVTNPLESDSTALDFYLLYLEKHLPGLVFPD